MYLSIVVLLDLGFNKKNTSSKLVKNPGISHAVINQQAKLAVLPCNPIGVTVHWYLVPFTDTVNTVYGRLDFSRDCCQNPLVRLMVEKPCESVPDLPNGVPVWNRSSIYLMKVKHCSHASPASFRNQNYWGVETRVTNLDSPLFQQLIHPIIDGLPMPKWDLELPNMNWILCSKSDLMLNYISKSKSKLDLEQTS